MTGAGATLSSNHILAGASGTALTWQLDSSTGRGTFDKFTLTDRSTDTASGVTPTLRDLPNVDTPVDTTVWLRVNDGTQDIWIQGWIA
jgi:hypothetical protein